LFAHYVEHPGDLPSPPGPDGDDPAQRTADHVAGMTDPYAIRTFERLFVPGVDP
jgi:dGTP triphosphohydrolase